MEHKGFYSYKKEGVNVKTVYELEWTYDSKVADKVEQTGDSTLLFHKTLDYLEDAMMLYNNIYYNDACILHMYEQIIVNDEIVLEQFKEHGFYIALDKISEKRVKQAEYEKEVYKKENELFHEFLKSCNAEKQFKEYCMK